MARYSIVRAWACVLQFEQAVRRNVQTEPWFYYVLFAVGDFLDFERHLGRLGTLTTPVAMLDVGVSCLLANVLNTYILDYIGFRTQPVDQTTHIHCDENVGMEATDVSATVLPLRNCGIPRNT
jgi:hypothetical protein